MSPEHYKIICYTANKLYKNSRSVRALGDIDDVIQIGVIGFLDAEKKFKPEKGFKFETYMVWRIRGEILDAARSAAFIKVPRQAIIHGEKFIPIESFGSDRLTYRNCSNRKTSTHKDFDPEDFYSCRNRVEKNRDIKEDIKIFLRGLSNRHLYIVVRYFGLDGDKSDTLKVIAKQLGLSESRLSQILSGLLKLFKDDSILQDYKVAS